uniref:Uncharacterized protein n=1 Tax=Romanomermis culicivorax TaxID=13658 RepID=A0A915I7I8_ROMCU
MLQEMPHPEILKPKVLGACNRGKGTKHQRRSKRVKLIQRQSHGQAQGGFDRELTSHEKIRKLKCRTCDDSKALSISVTSARKANCRAIADRDQGLECFTRSKA